MRLVETAKAEAKDNFDLVLKASALSEAKSQKLITSAGKQLHKKIVQATEAAIEAERTVVIIKTDHAIAMKSLKTQHKIALRDTQARQFLRFEKQKQNMTIEMNRLRELLYGQNEMIDGCLDEMKDERRATRQASDSAKHLKVIASDRMDKIKWWKG